MNVKHDLCETSVHLLPSVGCRQNEHELRQDLLATRDWMYRNTTLKVHDTGFWMFCSYLIIYLDCSHEPTEAMKNILRKATLLPPGGSDSFDLFFFITESEINLFVAFSKNVIIHKHFYFIVQNFFWNNCTILKK